MTQQFFMTITGVAQTGVANTSVTITGVANTRVTITSVTKTNVTIFSLPVIPKSPKCHDYREQNGCDSHRHVGSIAGPRYLYLVCQVLNQKQIQVTI